MIKVRGIAVVPSIYESIEGVDTQLRPSDIDSIVDNFTNNGSMIPFVDSHNELLQGGITTALWNTSDGLWFEGIIYEDVIETRIRTLIASGKTPNVSIEINPITDKGYIREYDNKKVRFYDGWVAEHLSIVNQGKCSHIEGCGIFEIIEGEDGNMTESEDKLVIKLEADIASKDADALVLSARIGELEATVAELTTSRDELKATVDATAEGLTLAATAKTDAIRAEILAIDADAKVTEITDAGALSLVLSVMQSVPVPKGKGGGNGGDVKSKATLRLEAAIEARAALG